MAYLSFYGLVATPKQGHLCVFPTVGLTLFGPQTVPLAWAAGFQVPAGSETRRQDQLIEVPQPRAVVDEAVPRLRPAEFEAEGGGDWSKTSPSFASPSKGNTHYYLSMEFHRLPSSFYSHFSLAITLDSYILRVRKSTRLLHTRGLCALCSCGCKCSRRSAGRNTSISSSPQHDKTAHHQHHQHQQRSSTQQQTASSASPASPAPAPRGCQGKQLQTYSYCL